MYRKRSGRSRSKMRMAAVSVTNTNPIAGPTTIVNGVRTPMSHKSALRNIAPVPMPFVRR